MERYINKGDVVNIYFNTANTIHRAKVIHLMGEEACDYYTVKDENGKIYHVQQYNYMEKL